MGFIVGVLPRDKALISFDQPYRAAPGEYHNFAFYVPGVQFALSVGKKLPSGTQDICFASNSAHPIAVDDFSRNRKGLFQRITTKAKKSKKLS